MKKLLFLVAITFSINTFSQSISQDVKASAGGQFSGTNATLDWTLGEAVTQTFSNSNNELTQGFHQPTVTISALEDFEPEVNVSIYPNPATSEFTIDVQGSELNFVAEIFDVNGKLVHSLQLNSNKNIDVSNWSNGIYVLSLSNNESQLLKSYKILKTK